MIDEEIKTLTDKIAELLLGRVNAPEGVIYKVAVEIGELVEDYLKRAEALSMPLTQIARTELDRLVYDKERRTIVDSRDPTRTGMFILHNCWKCSDGKRACVVGNPRQCEYPHARDD